MIIGLVGHSGTGKDTVADYLVMKYKFVKVSLADPLKRICKDVFDFSDEQLWGSSEKRNLPDSRYKGLTPRKALQLLGTEWGRAVYEDIWVEKTLERADATLKCNVGYDPSDGSSYGLSEPAGGVVIPDVRFQNEIDKISTAGGFIVVISRKNEDGSRAMSSGVSNHSSESGISKLVNLDECILNDGTIEQLYHELDVLIEDLKEREFK